MRARTLLAAALAACLAAACFVSVGQAQIRENRKAPPPKVETPAPRPGAATPPSPKAPVKSPPAPANRPSFEPEMVLIPAGSFDMGSPQSEQGRSEDEDARAGPGGSQVRVNISSFYVSKYEITFANWDACYAGGGCGGYMPSDDNWGRRSQPVINVSWNDAQAYVRWLSERTGKTYRLLTEAEWEYAARAGSTGRFSNSGGEVSLCGIANHADQSSSFPSKNTACSDGVGERTAPVGRYAANAFGLHDMHGNVWEWVQDCYADSYSGLRNDGSARETNPCSDRVFRGGGWGDYSYILRSAYRGNDVPSSRYIALGFRVARTP